MKNVYSVLSDFSKIIKLLKALLSFSLLITIPSITIAKDSGIQKEFLHFQHLNVENGLSQGTIYSIFQDSRGFLWLATQYGLNRYDGYSFKNYINNPADSLSISSNFILSIAEDKFGNLWIATENGLNKFDYNKNIFTRYLQDSTGMAVVSSVIVDKSGVVWERYREDFTV